MIRAKLGTDSKNKSDISPSKVDFKFGSKDKDKSENKGDDKKTSLSHFRRRSILDRLDGDYDDDALDDDYDDIDHNHDEIDHNHVIRKAN